MNLPAAASGGPVEQPVGYPSRIVLRMEFPSGAFREYTCLDPLGFRFAVAPSDDAEVSEPKIALMFAGNPAAGGISVNQAGRP